MSLKGVSQHFTLRMVIRGSTHPFFIILTIGARFIPQLFEILSFVPPVVVFLTIGFKIKERLVWFLDLLLSLFCSS